MKKLAILLILSCALVGCDIDTINPEAINNGSANAPTFHDNNNIFEIELPQGWVVAEQGELNDKAEIEIKNIRKNMYIVTMMENKEDTARTYEEYQKESAKMIQELYNAPIGEPKSVKVGSYNGNLYDFDGAMDTANFHMWIYIIETEHYYGKILGWTVKSLAGKNASEIQRIIQTFKENSASSAINQ